MSDTRASPGQVTQLCAVTQLGETDAYVTLFALCSDGSIWRLEEFDAGSARWEEIPPPYAREETKPE